jgi:pseudouridine synthase
MLLRLNKYLAQCGLGSRRKTEDLIKSGRIKINGIVAAKLGITIDTDADSLLLDDKPISLLEKKYYIILNKPRGYITTSSDEKGRMTVMHLIPEKYRDAGVFPVGRLDKDTEGLLLFTNDGEISYRLNLPSFEISKEYFVELDRPLIDSDKSKIEKGIFLHQLKLKLKRCIIKYADLSHTRISIKISEGKKRQIRYTFKNFNYKVTKLKRIAYGPLILKGINRGDIKVLKEREVKSLKELVSYQSTKQSAKQSNN